MKGDSENVKVDTQFTYLSNAVSYFLLLENISTFNEKMKDKSKVF